MDPPHRVGSDVPFLACLVALGGGYLLLIVAMLAADVTFTSWATLGEALSRDTIRYSVVLSLVSCTITAIVSLVIAVPVGYCLARWKFPGRQLIDAIFDIPIVLPPLVIGLSLLILFQTAAGQVLERFTAVVFDVLLLNRLLELIGVRPIDGITYEIPAVILSQFAVACAFAIRTMRATFDQIDPRLEDVALTLGCRRSQAFFRVVLPEAWMGVVTAGCLAWARAMGEFGPILVFAGATQLKTEVLPTSIWLALQVGDVEDAVAVSLFMVTVALIILVLTRTFGLRRGFI